ncbi:MAG: hypothetical protein R3F37_20760 [Candidatus Competibacteraceae bacterium]
MTTIGGNSTAKAILETQPQAQRLSRCPGLTDRHETAIAYHGEIEISFHVPEFIEKMIGWFLKTLEATLSQQGVSRILAHHWPLRKRI